MKSRNVEKLGKLLCKWIDSKGKMSRRPKNLSLLMIGYMQYVYNVLKSGRKVKFLMSDLVPYLEECGIRVEAPHDSEVNYTAYPG